MVFEVVDKSRSSQQNAVRFLDSLTVRCMRSKGVDALGTMARILPLI